ncbi:MAG: alpha-N-acetylglucosaminidase C-terminal domain-containing protein, partial [Clostridia bacterium]|nr:alpha-N-acetylglucosaminidase C-terminal domain-containing protein [Clostridia bacterium]
VVLDLGGMEAVWVAFLQKLGYTADEAKNFVCGYVYSSWWLMGNLEGYGGPVSDSWILDSLRMARRTRRFLRAMGAKTAGQIFSGMLPQSFASLAGDELRKKGFSDIRPYLTLQGCWNDSFVRPNVLSPAYDGFGYLASLFYQTQEELLGRCGPYYCGDICHEGGVASEGISRKDLSSSLMGHFLRYRPDGVWIIQGWMDNPSPETLEGFDDLGREHFLVLDLNSVGQPMWNNEKTWGGREFGGRPWIYSNIENFGGRTNLHGHLRRMVRDIVLARESSRFLKGIGFTPEAMNLNPAFYEIYFEMLWRKEAPDVGQWVEDYAARRYGGLTENVRKAWALFEESVYRTDSPDGSTKNSVIAGHPAFYDGHEDAEGCVAWYDTDLFEKGVLLLAKDAPFLTSTEGGVYDLADFLRLEMTLVTDEIHGVLWRALKLRDTELFEKYSRLMLKAMRLIDEIAAFKRDDRIGEWVGRAEDFATDPRNGPYSDFDRDLMRLNARMLPTVWASAPLFDYANRQYSGLVAGLYLPMWEHYMKKALRALKEGAEIPENRKEDWFAFEWGFVLDEKEEKREPSVPEGSGSNRPIRSVISSVRNMTSVRRAAREDIRRLKERLGEKPERKQI